MRYFARPVRAPPFDCYQVGRWIGRLAEHGRGAALLHARTETEWFRICWKTATAILFMAKRLIFVKPRRNAMHYPLR